MPRPAKKPASAVPASTDVTLHAPTGTTTSVGPSAFPSATLTSAPSAPAPIAAAAPSEPVMATKSEKKASPRKSAFTAHPDCLRCIRRRSREKDYARGARQRRKEGAVDTMAVEEPVAAVETPPHALAPISAPTAPKKPRAPRKPKAVLEAHATLPTQVLGL